MDRLFDRPVALSIGPQHCGTAWIQNYLERRGDVCLPADVKEIFYFDRHFQRGPEFYASHFHFKPKHKMIAELTTTAFDNPDAPSHVQKLLGADVKLFCPLRHPVERAKEVYKDYIKYGLVRGSIEEAVEHIPQILVSNRYGDHLQHWITQFGRSNIHIVFYETLQRDEVRFTTDLCDILEIPYQKPRKKRPAFFEDLFTKKEPPVVIKPADEAWLKTRLNPEISKLADLLGNDLSIWK